MPKSAEEIGLTNQANALEGWAGVSAEDISARMQPAWEGLRKKYLDQAREKYGDLDDEELDRRATKLRRADLARMAAESARVRRERKAAELFSADEVA